MAQNQQLQDRVNMLEVRLRCTLCSPASSRPLYSRVVRHGVVQTTGVLSARAMLQRLVGLAHRVRLRVGDSGER